MAAVYTVTLKVNHFDCRQNAHSLTYRLTGNELWCKMHPADNILSGRIKHPYKENVPRQGETSAPEYDLLLKY